jgi:hypothetical protein
LLKKKKKAKLSPTTPKPDPITETDAPILATKTVAPVGDSGSIEEAAATSGSVASVAAVGVAAA